MNSDSLLVIAIRLLAATALMVAPVLAPTPQTAHAAADFTDSGLGLPGVSESAVAWGDYDGDRDLDLLLTGCSSGGGGLCSTGVARIYRNDSGTFTDINAGLTGMWNSAAAWGDYDNDNDLDILLAGWTGSAETTKLYRNEGNGTFTDIEASLAGAILGTVTWGDYNNDGRLDILLTGCAGSVCDSSISRIYRNDGPTGNGWGFSDINAGLPGLYSSAATWGDYDTDGDLDLLLTGNHPTIVTQIISKVYRNDGDDVFTDVQAPLIGIQRGSAAWGDYDTDGDPDILLVGCSKGYGGGDCLNYAAKVYRNDAGNFTDINATLAGAYYATAAWGDYDNDGKPDIVLAGTLSLFGAVNMARIYHNDGGGTFSDIGAPIASVWQGAVAWGDYDTDGDLDLALTGEGPGFVTKVYRNDIAAPNTLPSTPSGLNAVVDGRSVTLSWNAANDTETPVNSLTYNLRAGTSPGGAQLMSPMSAANGYHYVPQEGNVHHGLTATLTNLWHDTTYSWSIQTIDSTFAGSAFADEGSFTTPPPTVQFAQAAYRVKESSTATLFTVNLSGPSPFTVTVDYATSNNTALAGSDYGMATGTLTFAPGVTSQSFMVFLLEDTQIDLEESFFVALNNPVNATLGTPGTAELTITDNDIPVQFESGEFVASEGGDPFKPITVTLGVAPPYTVTVDYATIGGTAQAGTEYLPVAYSLTFSPGVTRTVFTVTIFDDGMYEPAENVLVALSNSDNARLGAPVTTTLTVMDDDPLPIVQFSMSTISVGETAGNRVVGVSLSSASALTATVDYATRDGTALAGSDYLTTTGTLIFPPGTTTRSFSVPILDDAVIEGTEALSLTLSNPLSATLGVLNPVTLSVLDNDPVVAFSPGVYSATESESTAPITVTLNTASPVTATVTYSTYNYTAIAGSDYITTTGTLTFTPGVTTLTFTVPILDDAIGEPNERVYLWLSDPVSASLGINSLAFLTIVDDDPLLTIQLGAGAYGVSEIAGAAAITATLDRAAPFTATVQYTTSNVTALAGSDYLATTGTLTFTPGVTVLTITVPILNDALDEFDETLRISLFGSTNAVLGTPSQAPLTIADDDAPPTVQFSSNAFAVPEYDHQAIVAAILNISSTKTVTVTYTSSDGSARAGSDYVPVSGTLAFAPGVTQQTVTLSLINDMLDETDETFTLALSNPDNAALGALNPATFTLLDNDPVTPLRVTKVGDTADGQCDGADCSLREAIVAANAAPGDDIIHVPAGIYSLTLGELGITSDVTVAGIEATTTVITANHTSRIFNITGDVIVTLQDMSLTGGQPGLDAGGAILNYGGTLTLLNTILANNYAYNGGGGLFIAAGNVTLIGSAVMGNVTEYSGGAGILNNGGGPLNVVNSKIVGNWAQGAYYGGGIWSRGPLTVTGSLIADNTAAFGGGVFSSGSLFASNSTFSGNGAQFGGGIESRSGATLIRVRLVGNSAGEGGGMRHLGGVLLRDSAVVSNTASGAGGGVAGSVFSWAAVNTTFSGNQASSGGAISNGMSTESERLSLNNVTIAHNVATNGVGGLAGNRVDIRNTILAGNTGITPDCSGPVTSQGYNLIQDTTGCVILGDLTGNLTGVLAGLGPLQDNGGETLTHSLLPGSLAVDAGNPAMPGSGGQACEATDQRGTVRPQTRQCDIGAYEALLPALITPGEGGTITVTASFTTSLTFLPGAVSEPVTVTVEITSGQPTSTGFQLVSEALVLEAYKADGESVTAFAQPFTITIHYDDVDVTGLDETTLKMYFWDINMGQWTALSTEVDETTNRLTATADHLTMFALLGKIQQRLYLPLITR